MSTINRTEQMIESSLREVVEAALIATDGTAATGFGTELGGRIREEASTLANALADAGLLMPDIPDGLNLIGFERKGGGGGLLWDDRITTEALTKGYAAMFSRILEGDSNE